MPALSIVVGASEEVGAAIKDKLAALRAAGETREIYFEEPSVIVTGVPRAGRDDEYSAALARGNHKASAHVVERPVETSSPTAPKSPPPLSAQVASESEPRRVWATVEPPSEKTCGTILEGRWTIAGNMIRVLDMEGRLFTDTLGPNDNAEHVARRLLREKHGKNSSFYSPIKYPPASYH